MSMLQSSSEPYAYRSLPATVLPTAVSPAPGEIAQILRQQGVCLLRGSGVSDAESFQAFVSGLGFDLDDRYVGGAAPRSRIRSAVFNSTEADPSLIIGFHIEQCYQHVRSSLVAFYCHVAPEQYGETPVFDAAKVLEALPAALRQKLDALGVEYRRYFPAESRDVNFLKPWRTAFGVTEAGEVERLLDKDGIVYEWLADGGLMTKAHMPAVVMDPGSCKPCISINMYEQFSWPYMYGRFRDRFDARERRRVVHYMQLQTQDPHPFLQTRFGDGTPFTREESEAIQRAIWDNAEIFSWRKGDLLLVNNLRYGHGRLNFSGPREIQAILAGPYDVRHEQTNWFWKLAAPAPGPMRDAVPALA